MVGGLDDLLRFNYIDHLLITRRVDIEADKVIVVVLHMKSL